MSKITSVILFMTGVAVGAVASQQYFKKKYEDISNEEIESVKQAFRVEANEETITAAEMAKNKPDISEYTEKLKENGYTNYSNASKKEESIKEEKKPVVNPDIYVIAPEQFGEYEDYSQVSLTYYEGDAVLADELDEEIENVIELVGSDFIKHFGDYEDDSVYVRNEEIKTDYEILLDPSNFANVVQSKPRPIELEDE